MHSNPDYTKIHRPSCSAKYLLLNMVKIHFKLLSSNFISIHLLKDLRNSKTNTVEISGVSLLIYPFYKWRIFTFILFKQKVIQVSEERPTWRKQFWHRGVHNDIKLNSCKYCSISNDGVTSSQYFNRITTFIVSSLKSSPRINASWQRLQFLFRHFAWYMQILVGSVCFHIWWKT